MDTKKRKAETETETSLSGDSSKKSKKFLRNSKWTYSIPSTADLQERLTYLDFLKENQKPLTPRMKQYLVQWVLDTQKYIIALINKQENRKNLPSIPLVFPKVRCKEKGQYNQYNNLFEPYSIDRSEFDRFWIDPTSWNEFDKKFCFQCDSHWIKKMVQEELSTKVEDEKILMFLLNVKKEYDRKRMKYTLISFEAFVCEKASKWFSIELDKVKSIVRIIVLCCFDWC